MPSTILYCADPLRSRRVDDHFAAEAARWRDLGGTVALIDHDALLADRTTEAVRAVPAGAGEVWYRGWMIPTAFYTRLDEALRAKGSRLATNPHQYARAHELPGWYRPMTAVTPSSAWTPLVPRQHLTSPDITTLTRQLPSGPGMVKDYVKSRKHDPDAFHIHDLADTETVRSVVNRFIDRQGDDLSGGIVLRAFENFACTEGRAIETRIWWLDGESILTGPHPDAPDQMTHPDLAPIAPLVQALDCRFITTDLAQTPHGTPRLVEIGDAQVSDLPSTTDPTPLLLALLRGTATRRDRLPVDHGLSGLLACHITRPVPLMTDQSEIEHSHLLRRRHPCELVSGFMIVGNEDGYEIDTDANRLDVGLVHHWLSTDAFWAEGRTRETVEQSIQASENFGLYEKGGRLVGYARVVTDLATFAWLCDVYIAPDHRGKGLGTWLAVVIRDYLAPYKLKRVLLATLDAHEVYAKVGFVPFPDPQKLMILNPAG